MQSAEAAVISTCVKRNSPPAEMSGGYYYIILLAPGPSPSRQKPIGRNGVVFHEDREPFRTEDVAGMVGGLLVEVPAIHADLLAELVAVCSPGHQEVIEGGEKAVGYCVHINCA